MAKAKEPTQRQLRVGEAIRHVLARQLMRDETGHPSLSGQSITVTEVEVGPDMRHATAFVTPLGGGEMKTEILEALNEVAPHFNHIVAQELPIKFTPRIRFEYDQRFDYADRINTLLINADK
jgi:ribosome-binding factor A